MHAIDGNRWAGGEKRLMSTISKKAIVLMGDAPGHDPEPLPGSLATVIAGQ